MVQQFHREGNLQRTHSLIGASASKAKLIVKKGQHVASEGRRAEEERRGGEQ